MWCVIANTRTDKKLQSMRNIATLHNLCIDILLAYESRIKFILNIKNRIPNIMKITLVNKENTLENIMKISLVNKENALENILKISLVKKENTLENY